jgi:uncharacterized low-complexity protein
MKNLKSAALISALLLSTATAASVNVSPAEANTAPSGIAQLVASSKSKYMIAGKKDVSKALGEME